MNEYTPEQIQACLDRLEATINTNWHYNNDAMTCIADLRDIAKQCLEMMQKPAKVVYVSWRGLL